MRLCKIVNLSPIDVVVEDVGIRLGGGCSSQPLLLDSVRASRDVLRHGSRLRVEEITPHMPIWPFLPAKVAPKTEGDPLPQLPPPPIPSAPVQAPSAPVRSDTELVVLLTQIRDLLSSGAPLPSPAPTVPQGSGVEFIPSNIVPEEAASSISPTETSTDATGIEDSLAALRRLRKR